MSPHTHSRPRGVTIVELTVVISMIISLISALFVSAKYYKEASDRSTCITQISQYQRAVRAHQNSHNFIMLPLVPDLIELFDSLDGSAKLELLVEFGDRLPPLADPYLSFRDAGLHMILECQSPVFLLVNNSDGKIAIHGDVPREAPIARGFVGLLFDTFNGISLADAAVVPADLLATCGLRELLTFQRNRGLSAIYGAFLEACARTEVSK